MAVVSFPSSLPPGVGRKGWSETRFERQFVKPNPAQVRDGKPRVFETGPKVRLKSEIPVKNGAAMGDPERMKADRESKDFWDKAASLSGIVATVLIAGVGFYFTNKYETANYERNATLDKHQTRLRELEAVERLLPHFSGEGTTADRQKLAILALRELGSKKLAAEFAEILGTEGAIAALTYTAKTSDSSEERERATKALSRLKLGTGRRRIEDPKADDIIDGLNSLKGGTDHFAIFEKGDDSQHYMQTIGGPELFTLEYREGSKDRHFQCTTTKDNVIKAFKAYAADDASWRTICDWKKLNLK